jgi:hypothetical protein
MSDIYDTGSEGERLLTAYLSALGRSVSRSDKKMFDLVVDGRCAEVKSSRERYSKLGFIGLSKNQYEAITHGVDFSLFIVCNLKDPANLEVVEFPAGQLLAEQPKIEPTYFWYRTQIEKCRLSQPAD